jgi:hypothetical protein
MHRVVTYNAQFYADSDRVKDPRKLPFPRPKIKPNIQTLNRKHARKSRSLCIRCCPDFNHSRWHETINWFNVCSLSLSLRREYLQHYGLGRLRETVSRMTMADNSHFFGTLGPVSRKKLSPKTKTSTSGSRNISLLASSCWINP